MDMAKNAYNCTDELYKHTNTVRESALNADWEEDPLAILGRGTCIGGTREPALNHISYAPLPRRTVLQVLARRETQKRKLNLRADGQFIFP